jgi:hypothetical protein
MTNLINQQMRPMGPELMSHHMMRMYRAHDMFFQQPQRRVRTLGGNEDVGVYARRNHHSIPHELLPRRQCKFIIVNICNYVHKKKKESYSEINAKNSSKGTTHNKIV